MEGKRAWRVRRRGLAVEVGARERVESVVVVLLLLSLAVEGWRVENLLRRSVRRKREVGSGGIGGSAGRGSAGLGKRMIRTLLLDYITQHNR